MGAWNIFTVWISMSWTADIQSHQDDDLASAILMGDLVLD